MVTFICSHCGMVAESNEDSLEYGAMLICNHCGKDTVVQLVKGEDYSRIEMGIFEAKMHSNKAILDAQTYDKDLPLYRDLGLRTFKGISSQSDELFLGQVNLEDGATVKIYVRCLPAQFYRADITTRTGKKFNVQSGSGTLSRYWPVFLNVAENLIEVTEITEVQHEN